MSDRTPPVRARTRRPAPPWLVTLAVTFAGGSMVALIAGQFDFVPVGRQIAWLGSSFTLTAACVAYVVQSARRTDWDETEYEAARRRLSDSATRSG